MPACRFLLALVLLCTSSAELVAVQHVSTGLRGAQTHAHGGTTEDVSELGAVEVDGEMEALVDRLLSRHKKSLPSRQEILNRGLKNVDIKAAVKQLEGQVPPDVASLVRVSVEGKTTQPWEEASLQKARKVLNLLVEKAWAELDEKLMECKVFEDRNRDTFEQVITDVARLGETIADFERLRVEAGENIAAKNQEMMALIQAFIKELIAVYGEWRADVSEMWIRLNDLAVFQFMMELTKCPKSGSSLLQQTFFQPQDSAAAFVAKLGPPTATGFPGVAGQDAERQLRGLYKDPPPSPKKEWPSVDLSQVSKASHVCETEQGFELNFEDAKVKAHLDRIMTPGARQAIREVLGQVQGLQAAQAATSIQAKAKSAKSHEDDDSDVDESDGGKDDGEETMLISLGADPATTTATTTVGTPTPPVEKTKVVKRIDVNIGWKDCKDDTVPDCGLLHDTMSIMWGKYKDLVDELRQSMEKKRFEWDEYLEDAIEQYRSLAVAKSRFMMQLNEVISNLNGAREELSQKEGLRIQLEHEYAVFMRACRKRIRWIMYQDMCVFILIRGKTMKYSKTSPPEKIVDCDVSDWVADECSKTCDNDCKSSGKYDMSNPCGGTQMLRRSVSTENNEFGIKCPVLEKSRVCGQIKCPVDCSMSQWSGWSACTRECEGGVKGRTRAILVQPEHGGMSCNTVNDQIECNTESCDRDCSLKRWSKFTPCSVACGGGTQQKVRRVRIPIRGKGKCPTENSRWRNRVRACNTHECKGDEICIARQDLIMAIDGSGSLRQSGFDTLKEFAASLTEKYMGVYHGYEDMRIGVVQFGNGEVLYDASRNVATQTISDALEILPLTSDMAEVKKKIEAITFQKGFTNMAQAFTKTETMFQLRGRKEAMSAVMTLTDGKPSFLFQTYEKVQQLKDKHIQLFFVPVIEFKGEEFALMKKWASQPWETNLVRIPGLDALAADGPVFAQKLLVKFCPNAISPSETTTEEVTLGYMLVREEGICGAKGRWLSKSLTGGAAACAALAEGAGFTSFALGIRYARGRCRAMGLKVDADVTAGFKKDRAKPVCPATGGWKRSKLYDFYALIPVV